jgi:hypothetical protein
VPQWYEDTAQLAINVPAAPEKRNHVGAVLNGNTLSHNEILVLKKET